MPTKSAALRDLHNERLGDMHREDEQGDSRASKQPDRQRDEQRDKVAS
ncbi:MAG TPA: hypothetical protein VGO31_09865 [Microbacteriaceae bacterium]|jgi:hypothetical protein|nr:hypothetical protein [Microbacteriaceae bacterium]